MNQSRMPGDGWRALSTAFRRRSFLWKFAIGTMLTGAAIGLGVGLSHETSPAKLGERILAASGIALEEDDPSKPSSDPNQPDITRAFIAEVSQGNVDYIDLLWAGPVIAPHINPSFATSVRSTLAGKFTPAETDIFLDYVVALNSPEPAAFARLQAIADGPNAPRFANYLVGRIELRRENHQAAYQRFHKEGERETARESRYLAVQSLIAAKDYPALTSLLVEPRYARYATAQVKLELAIGQRDWRGILQQSPLAQIASYQTSLVIMTLMAGLAWAFFLGHLGEMERLLSLTSLLCLLAFCAGALSTIPTIYLVIIEEDIFHFTDGVEALQILAYNVGGVGVREEVCKLLFFVPFLPLLLRRDDELEVLMVASFVGLGFAIEENCGYFLISEATSGPGRFLTANFLHLALTGLNGLALFRAFTQGSAGINQFLFVFPATIVVHGLYDALPDLPDLNNGGGYLAMCIYAGVALYYFKEVHPLRNNIRMTLGLTGAFVVSVSVVAATVIAYVMIDLGPAAGLTAIVPELLGTAVLLFLFFHEFDEQLTA